MLISQFEQRFAVDLVLFNRDSPDAGFRRRPCSVPARQARPKGPERDGASREVAQTQLVGAARPGADRCSDL
jgi:hypothetical protein